MSIILLAFCAQPVQAYYTNMPASVVIGQQDFTHNTANKGAAVDATSISQPIGVTMSDGKLIMADRTNNRVLIYNHIPTTNNAAADVVIGQQNFTANSANQGGAVAANTLSSPRGVLVVSDKLFVADRNNNRVLIYNHIPTSNNASADVVIGQAGFSTATSGASASQYTNPTGVAYDDASGKLVVADSNTNRVLVYNQVPVTNGASADVVVGQPDFVTTTGACAANRIFGVLDTKVVNGKLILPDAGNNRILIYNAIPTANGAAADIVLGQSDLTHCLANQGGSASASTTAFPSGIGFDGKRLFIYDANNSRLLRACLDKHVRPLVGGA